MKKMTLVLVMLMCIGGILNAGVVIDDDFDDAAMSKTNWSESTYGSLASFSVNYDTTNRPSEVTLGLTCETSGTLGEVEITHKTHISATKVADDPITQTLTLGSFSNGGTGEIWLMGDDGSSGTFDRNATNGGYLRVAFSYSTGAVTVYARGMGDSMQTLLSTSVATLEENDIFSVTYDEYNVSSLTFYDASLDTTSTLVSSPIAHGLDFGVDFANGGYTALSLYTWSTNIVTYHSITVEVPDAPVFLLGDANGDGVVSAGDYASVQANFGNTLPSEGTTTTPEPATVSLLSMGVVAVLRRKR